MAAGGRRPPRVRASRVRDRDPAGRSRDVGPVGATDAAHPWIRVPTCCEGGRMRLDCSIRRRRPRPPDGRPLVGLAAAVPDRSRRRLGRLVSAEENGCGCSIG